MEENPTSHPAAACLQAYEARRCAACCDRHPSFGFGPPLSRDGTTVWACGEHREAVDRQMTRHGRFDPVAVAEPPRSETALSRTREGRQQLALF